jgi:hypothetical protein
LILEEFYTDIDYEEYSRSLGRMLFGDNPVSEVVFANGMDFNYHYFVHEYSSIVLCMNDLNFINDLLCVIHQYSPVWYAKYIELLVAGAMREDPIDFYSKIIDASVETRVCMIVKAACALDKQCKFNEDWLPAIRNAVHVEVGIPDIPPDVPYSPTARPSPQSDRWTLPPSPKWANHTETISFNAVGEMRKITESMTTLKESFGNSCLVQKSKP